MRIALIEIKSLFGASLLFAVFCHLTIWVLISFTLGYQPSAPKPQITFLGSILSPHDLSITEPIAKIIPITTMENSAFHLESANGFQKKEAEALARPLFIPKVISKEKNMFKPPKELFITQLPPPPEKDQGNQALEADANIPQHMPLKLQ